MSGRRPDVTKTWTFQTSFRDVGKNWTTMPQAFKKAGYFSCGMGKTYHDDGALQPPNYDAPYSWSDECEYYTAPRQNPNPACSQPLHTQHPEG